MESVIYRRLVLVLAVLTVAAVAIVVVVSRGGSTSHKAQTTAPSYAQTGAYPTPTTTPTQQAEVRPEQVAGAFVAAYLTWRWDEPSTAPLERVRPFATAGFAQRLQDTPPGQWSNPGGKDLQETDTVEISDVQAQNPGASRVRMAVSTTVTSKTKTGETRQFAWVEVYAVHEASGWKVDEVNL